MWRRRNASVAPKSTSSWVVARLVIFGICTYLQPMDFYYVRPGTLIVGNSMVYFNDGVGIFRALEGGRVDAVTGGGLMLSDHVRHLLEPGSILRSYFNTRDRYESIVLQEGGAAVFEPELQGESFPSLLFLGEEARRIGADFVLYEQPTRTPFMDRVETCADYHVFQTHAHRRYLNMAQALRLEGHVVRVAPAGRAFQLVAETLEAREAEACEEGSEFDLLFGPDDHHPSLRGTYLAMVVVLATARSLDPRVLADEPRLGPVVSARLRDFAWAAIESERSVHHARAAFAYLLVTENH